MDLSSPGLLARSGTVATPPGGAASNAALVNAQAAAPLPSVAVLLMSRVHRSSVPWALGRLVMGAGPLRDVPGLRFARVLGSGRQGGFGLRPGLDCQGVFALFDGLQDAMRFANDSACAAAYRSRAAEGFSAVLLATSAKGSWSGQGMAAAAAAPDPSLPHLPVAALTRAAIRPRHLLRFWRHSPPAERELAQAPGCRLAVGLGEAPLLRQATFSLWDNTAAMDHYARQGAHQRAIQAAYGGHYFSESMFVRFVPLALQGRWHGRDVDGLAGG